MNAASTKGILHRYAEDAPPLKIDALIKELGIEIVHKKDMSNDQSAHLRFDFEKNKYVISVNDTHHEKRKNFSKAHELGHYFLHRDQLNTPDDFLWRKVNHRLTPEEHQREAEANRFAAGLLVSNEALDRTIQPLDTISVQTLSDLFCVSEQVIQIRMKSYRQYNSENYNKICP